MFRQECVNSTLAISGRPQAVLESFCPSMMTSSSPAPVIEHRKESLDFAAIGKLFHHTYIIACILVHEGERVKYLSPCIL
jgi:hypothetical protein